MRIRMAVLLIATGLSILLAAVVTAEPAMAEGHDLTGRMAPDMTFPKGTNGVTPGMTLSSLRGRVVWVKFILRDCPRCVLELPRTQLLHERWGRSGLIVIVVVHQLGPEQMASFMQQNGYTFPLATDPRGDLARRYGVHHRPTNYVIGVDGRVKSSNAAPDQVILTELGHYRLARLGRVPAELEEVRAAVWKWDYGTALRKAEAAAAEPEASADVKRVAEQVLTLAREDLEARVHRAQELERRRRTADAKAFYDRLVEVYRGTSLEAEATKARRAFEGRTTR